MNGIDVLLAGPYNPLYAGGFALAFGLAAWEGYRRGWPPLPWLCLLGACITGGIAGSKLLHFDLHLAEPGEKTILGGLAGGMLALFAAQRLLRFKEDSFTALGPATLLGFALGRVGCFLVGCCFGHPTAAPWGVRYAVGTRPFEAQNAAGLLDPGAILSLQVHPTQFYEAALALLLAAGLWSWGSRLRSAGAAALVVGLGYSLIRFGVEFYRAGGTESLHYGLKTVQWTLLVVVIATLAVLLWRELRARRTVLVLHGTSEASCAARAAVLVAGMFAFLVVAEGWLTPLERVVSVGGLLPSGLLLLSALAHASAWRTAGSLAVATLFLVPLVPDTIPGYPRSYYTVGGGASIGRFESVHDLSPGDDCGPAEHREHAYRAFGVSGTYTHLTSPTQSYSARIRAFAGRNRVERINGAATNQEVTIRGAAVTGTTDARSFGLTGGLLAGELIDSDGLPGTGVEVIAGARVGSLQGLFAELQYNDHEPTPNPHTRLKASVGYGFGQDGSNLRVGRWEGGVFLGGRIVTRSGFEIEPFVGVPGDELTSQYGLVVRQRLGSGARPGSP
jgi:hypothetical protein